MSTKRNVRGAKRKKGTATKEKRKIQVDAVIAKVIENPSIPIGAAIREVGLSEFTAQHPASLTRTEEWSEALDKFLSQDSLLSTHQNLLKASRIDHLVFTREGEPSDEEIKLMLEEVGCTLRKIVHGEQARHAYFFAPDNRARKDALDLAYKLRGSYAVDKASVAFSLVQLASMRIAMAKELGAGEPIPELPAADAPSMPFSA